MILIISTNYFIIGLLQISMGTELPIYLCANLFHNFLFEWAEVETVRDVIVSVSGDSILMSKQSMHAARLDAARAPKGDRADIPRFILSALLGLRKECDDP